MLNYYDLKMVHFILQHVLECCRLQDTQHVCHACQRYLIDHVQCTFKHRIKDLWDVLRDVALETNNIFPDSHNAKHCSEIASLLVLGIEFFVIFDDLN